MQPFDRIHVRFYGETGPQVILLHGGPGAPGDLAPLARHLGNNFRVLEPLQRLSDSIPLTVARHVADLYGVIHDTATDIPIRLTGHSWGAMLALTYAARYPADIDRVVLIGCGSFDKGSREAYQTCMAQRMNSEIKLRLNNINMQLAVEKDPQRRNESFAELAALCTRLQSFKPLSTGSEALVCDERGNNETWNDALYIQEQGIQPAEFARIQAAVTMIHGDKDPHPGPMIYKSLAPIIPTIQYHEIPRCGHMPWIEQEAREEFFKLLGEILS